MSVGGGTTNSQSKTENLSRKQINSTYTPQMNTGVQANGMAANLLGVGGDPTAANAAFQNYLGSTGYNFQLGQGQNAVASSNSAAGLLNSGSAIKGLAKYGQNLASTSFQNYLGNLNQVSANGIQAGGLISNTGQVSGSKSNSWNANVGFG